jgi:hypothetical protein
MGVRGAENVTADFHGCGRVPPTLFEQDARGITLAVEGSRNADPGESLLKCEHLHDPGLGFSRRSHARLLVLPAVE